MCIASRSPTGERGTTYHAGSGTSYGYIYWVRSVVGGVSH